MQKGLLSHEWRRADALGDGAEPEPRDDKVPVVLAGAGVVEVSGVIESEREGVLRRAPSRQLRFRPTCRARSSVAAYERSSRRNRRFGRDTLSFQYAWRFHYGDDPSSPPESGRAAFRV